MQWDNFHQLVLSFLDYKLKIYKYFQTNQDHIIFSSARSFWGVEVPIRCPRERMYRIEPFTNAEVIFILWRNYYVSPICHCCHWHTIGTYPVLTRFQIGLAFSKDKIRMFTKKTTITHPDGSSGQSGTMAHTVPKVIIVGGAV